MVWVSIRQDGAPDLGVGRGGVQTLGSGEVETKPKGRARRSPPSVVRQGGTHGLGVGRGGAHPQGSDEAKPVASVSGEAEPALRGRLEL